MANSTPGVLVHMLEPNIRYGAKSLLPAEMTKYDSVAVRPHPKIDEK